MYFIKKAITFFCVAIFKMLQFYICQLKNTLIFFCHYFLIFDLFRLCLFYNVKNPNYYYMRFEGFDLEKNWFGIKIIFAKFKSKPFIKKKEFSLSDSIYVQYIVLHGMEKMIQLMKDIDYLKKYSHLILKFK